MNNAIASDTTFIPFGQVQKPANLTASTTVTLPSRTNGIIFTVEGGNVRITFGTQAATATVGLLVTPGDTPIRFDCPTGTRINFIEAVPASGALVAYQFISTL